MLLEERAVDPIGFSAQIPTLLNAGSKLSGLYWTETTVQDLGYVNSVLVAPWSRFQLLLAIYTA